MKALLLTLALFCATAQGQVLDIGDGSRVVITRTGAYVPMSWIDEAVDSVGQWRMGSDREKLARMALVSMAREIEALRAQVATYQQQHERDSAALVEVNAMAGETVDELNTAVEKEQQRNARLKPWANIGKVTAVAAAVLIAAFTIKTVAP